MKIKVSKLFKELEKSGNSSKILEVKIYDQNSRYMIGFFTKDNTFTIKIEKENLENFLAVIDTILLPDMTFEDKFGNYGKIYDNE